MSEKAPMPPWWVSESDICGAKTYYVCGGPGTKPVVLFFIRDSDHSNAKELADLIVQRTKQ